MTELLLIQTDSNRQFLAVIVFFYDAPTPSGVFDDFLAIPTTEGNVSTTSYSSFVQNMSIFAPNGLRLVAQSAVRWSRWIMG
jgi:hypothetical protein